MKKKGKLILASVLKMEVQVLIACLLTICAVVGANQNDRFWCQQSQLFYETYLSGRTLVIESLEREGNVYLIHVNEKLVRLRQVFEHIRSSRFQEAFSIIGDLGLLPLAQSEITERETQYKNLDKILQQAFAPLIRGTMECLLGMHRQLRSESRGRNDTVEQRLSELQKMARFIYIFSGLVGMPVSVKEYVQQKRNNML